MDIFRRKTLHPSGLCEKQLKVAVAKIIEDNPKFCVLNVYYALKIATVLFV